MPLEKGCRRPEKVSTPTLPADIKAGIIVRQRMGKHDGSLSRTNLSGLCLAAAGLGDISWSNADMAHAKLAGANLNGAEMTGANLKDADLIGADLTDVEGLNR